ncbi:MAG: GntR family transcriptional regulator, partial [Shewanella sp.]
MLKQETIFPIDDTQSSVAHSVTSSTTKVKSLASEKSSTTLADQILVQIQTSIIKGELPAGSKINEQALAEKY